MVKKQPRIKGTFLMLALLSTALIVGGITMEKNSSMVQRDLIVAKLGTLEKAEYGGSYWDDDGKTIHINLVTDHPVGIAESDMVKTHTVQYTLQQLEDLQHELTPRMLELNIQSLYVNTQENRIFRSSMNSHRECLN